MSENPDMGTRASSLNAYLRIQAIRRGMGNLLKNNRRSFDTLSPSTTLRFAQGSVALG